MPSINKKKSMFAESFNEAANDRVTQDENKIFATQVMEETNKIINAKADDCEYIHRELIYPNPYNVPYMSEITDREFDALKASILDQGLFHNLVVIDDGRGKYRIISGEKRWTAISRMTKEEYNSTFPNGILTKILPVRPNLTADDELIMLLTCNVLAFSNGTPDAKQLRDLVRLYKKKGLSKKELVDFLNFYLKKGNGTIYKMLNEANAIDELYDLYSNKIVVRSALQLLGGLKEDQQMQAVEYIKNEHLVKVDEATAAEIVRQLKYNSKSSTKEDSVWSVSFSKFEKLMKSAEGDLAKTGKINKSIFSPAELELAISKLEIFINHAKELKEELTDYRETKKNK